MEYRELGRTGLMVSEIGFGAEWMPADSPAFTQELVDRSEELGINIVDCWMVNPGVRKSLGDAVCKHRDKWIVQGHFGATWDGEQYERTRDMAKVKPAWEFLLDCFGGHIELGLIHYVDKVDELDQIMNGEFIAYVRAEKAAGHIDHIGLSTHNANVAVRACDYPEIEMIMFSLNPAFDMLPPSEDINMLFAENYDASLANIDPKRQELHRLCDLKGVGLTVMKPFAGGRLLDAAKSPFGVAMTPAQCIEYCLTRPAVASVIAGYRDAKELDGCAAYVSATPVERDFTAALAGAPTHTYYGQCIYCGHCQPCAVGINIAEVNKFYDLASMHDEVPESVKSHYEALDMHATDCIFCETCEPNCPFGVKIAARMAHAGELFGL